MIGFHKPVSATTVHPHGCGENPDRGMIWRVKHGSPPRVWGKCRLKTRRPRLRRFTPTGVGKIAADVVTGLRETVHPHGCGENQNFQNGLSDEAGSPPRVWGKCTSIGVGVVTARFTPTGVGKIVVM